MEQSVSRRDWLIIFSAVVLAWTIDYVGKQWALDNIFKVEFWGPFGLVLHRNPGAMLGMFSDLPPVLRIVSLSTGGAFLIFVYAAIQYLLPLRFFTLRLGMSLLLGGIMGNVTDRIIWGSVVDFLLIGSPEMSTPAFNPADAIQWVGYFMIVYALVKDGKHLWPSENSRKQLWINPSFQIRYCLKLMGIGAAFSIISGVFAFTYLKVVIDDLVIGAPFYIEKKFIIPFMLTYGVICLSFIIMLFLIGRILSHRTAGPIFAFENYIKDLIKGNDRSFKLRQGDEFKHLEDVAEVIRPHLLKADIELPEGAFKNVPEQLELDIQKVDGGDSV